MILDGRTLRPPGEWTRAGWAVSAKKGSKVHAAVDTLGDLFALKSRQLTSEQATADLVEEVQQATGESVE